MCVCVCVCVCIVHIVQELNGKAEAKFTKLKAQAKAKITALTEELEKLKSELGGTAGNVSVQVRAAVAVCAMSNVCDCQNCLISLL